MTNILPIITISAAKASHWDVIIAGSSFAAMFFLKELPSNLKVLVIEKGQIQPHSDQIQNDFRVTEAFAIKNSSNQPKDWIAHSIFGRNSNCWWACTPRMHPNDFRMKELYGVGEDWPISYAELETAYHQAEVIMQIAGGGSDHILPRSQPFPYPPHTFSRSDIALQAHSPNWFAQPTARANGGDRNQCCANGICNLCPVDAKFTILNSLETFQKANVSLLLESDVRLVDISAGLAKGVLVRGADQAEHVISGALVALGTNAIFNAAILLRSGIQSPALGQNLHEQVSLNVIYDLGGGQQNYYGGTSIPGHGYDLYDGPHRSEYGAVLIENHNAPAAIRPTPGRWTERLKLKLIAEDLPNPENRVVLEDDEVKIEWTGHSDYAERALQNGVEKLPDLLPFQIEAQIVSALAVTEEHIQGTHRMGNNPLTSVVDKGSKCHGVRNLLALGSGSFPSCSPANPTLTLSALSLYAARAL